MLSGHARPGDGRRRGWLVAAAVAIALAGCGGSGAAARSTTTTNLAGVSGGVSTIPLPAGGKAPPGCSAAVAPAHTLAVTTTTVSAGSSPFGVASSLDGHYLFVAGGDGVSVFGLSAGRLGPLIRTVASTVGGGEGFGETLTPDGQHLLVAVDGGLAVYGVDALEHGGPALEGTLLGRGGGGIEVAATPDGRYAFVSFEDTDDVGVFDLARALEAGFGSTGVVLGTVPVGEAPVGITVSPDGRWVYVTSELDPAAGGTSSRSGGVVDCSGGSLSVISVASAEADPATTRRVVAPAGASPVRVALGDGGAVAWVTARGSDALLAFSTAQLTAAEPGAVVDKALLADVPVGAAPVGVAVAGGGRYVVVADSNRFGGGSGKQWLSIVDATAALHGGPALLGQVAAGAFPRDLTVSPDGRTVYVSNYASGGVESVEVGAIAGD